MMSAQQQLDHMQNLYRQWTLLLPQLQQDIARWQQAIAIMQQLDQFYSNGGYRDLRDLEEQGVALNTNTQGEYSILSEDAIWNALNDCQDLAWQHLRSAIKVLDREAA